ncbi:hypothetical protein PHYBLDRAFT_147642 [Phycomyces blakesleeanus NRRL 1555(-)]|uniref:Tc1-like transposase DDE domain-containing protein n=1 Tax=Phycomyces blakesleeanus (strain ATCC 8743b / DSM 1359 / FGSC 10004 / NBRC 33097 / NRRL 1555) TaxID=763407 RepID=A0A162TUN1_PHYB8|nr:hypothetical protein PHYBLDRAFT_147642 [Phycomyces blakesleeanus NRRL 1555(-)]OAD71132.1 hypothetical protein PHYBLDRAFT_147642 [Phycomyces blakesleeanus NRRL 1555(-)]|eukprot:XP_018289172.1 hypothetical protein PHYBLDRAFT_147642 [Phycomyces blakesleeanus NRRL 1555(-)]
MTRRKVWSKREEPSIEETPSIKYISKPGLGGVSSPGAINISIRKVGNVKRRKVAGATKRKAPEDRLSLPKDITGSHFVQFVVDTMDIMDQFPEVKGYHIVMDNALIHVHSIVNPTIIRRGYTPAYLSTYSSELNKIEQFWEDIKHYFNREKLKDNKTLTYRMMDACERVHLQNI